MLKYVFLRSLASSLRYALPQIHFEDEALTRIPNGSFNSFHCKSTSEQDIKMKSVHERFHDSKLKFVKALLFLSFYETEVLMSFYCFTFICGRAYCSRNTDCSVRTTVVYIYLSKSTINC